MKHPRIDPPKFGKTAQRLLYWLAGLVMLSAANACLALDFAADFVHDQTGFPLDFQHGTLKCESCHLQGVFAGTPRECDQCHSHTGRIRASSTPDQHILVTGDCEYCHTPNAWTPVIRVDHIAVVGPCQYCHNGVTATGKNPGHIKSGDDCDDCHRSFTWRGAVFDHANVTGNCFSCHNGNIAEGMNRGHIRSTNDCEDCHGTYSWTPITRLNHNAVFGNCQSCHNGVVAEGKNPLHIASPNNCALCHGTHAWLPASFEHRSPAFPGEHRRNLDCSDCHIGNSKQVAWTNAAYQPDCAGCHAGDFKSGPHKKHENPDAQYSVSELRDCSGSCHIYTDSSLTTIKERRNREHRVSDGEF